MKCGHVIQLLTLTLLCVFLFFLAPSPYMKALVLFPLFSFFLFLILELYHLFLDD